MRFTLTLAAPILAFTAIAAPAMAQDAATDPRCAAVRVAIPPELSRWSQRTALAAGTSTRSAPVLVIGRATDLRLTTADRVTVAAAPGRDAEAGSTAGLALFQVARAGTYRVALGEAAWIDVIRAGRALPSTAHGHGPMCSGIRKIVDFRLTPGRYVLQIAGTPAASVPVMIARGAAA
ncbi:MAG: homogentisate 1,2-dioxygenase [Sphingomonas adhaesiva]|uniref:homogentisate 1,2-dioxygenase n=1 Tax=Sphingomonas adhaesiva TaxID=28212 RepID=UPI002FFB752B